MEPNYIRKSNIIYAHKGGKVYKQQDYFMSINDAKKASRKLQDGKATLRKSTSIAGIKYED